MNQETVVIVGASNNPERYSHRALLLLRKDGHAVVPVHPALAEIEGIPVVADVGSISGPVDTVTMYVGPAISSGLQDKLIALKPGRVIFNPGAENASLADALQKAGIVCEEACTLVLLNTGQF
ncbi:MAG: CoA-binding protein [Verrucomicrobia bacterium]|nr:CoA-binding protein [Verrucomicrobiota bacterium]